MENQTFNFDLDNVCTNMEEDGHRMAYWSAIVGEADAADDNPPKQFKCFTRNENDAVTQMLKDLDNYREREMTQYQKRYDVSEKVELRDISAARQYIETVSSAIKYINGHNDPIVTWLNEELLSIREMEYEKLFGSEKEELMEIYRTGDTDIDQEFEHELECGLRGKIQAIEEQLQQRIKFLNTIRF